MSHKLDRLRATLRRGLRARAKARVDEFLAEIDPDSQMPIRDVLLSHVAMGYEIEIDIAVQVIHPAGPERQPNETAGIVEVAKH
jgi:hypothetical protein